MTTKTMPTKTFVLSRRKKSWSSCFDALHPEVLSSHSRVRESVCYAGKDALWISEKTQFTRALLQCVSKQTPSPGNLLLLYMPAVESMPVLNKYFRHTVFGTAESFLPPEELVVVLANDRKADLVIGGIIDRESERLVLWRGSLEPFPVPFAAFTPSGDGVVPDFDKFRVIDYGQTIQLGPYEATTESLLYEFDPDYRRRIGKKRRESDQSFGAALRRLRKQRGLRREDFTPLSAKTIARIEQGVMLPERLRESTRRILSQKLGVEPDEIETF